MGCKQCNNKSEFLISSNVLQVKSSINNYSQQKEGPPEDVEKFLHYMNISDTLKVQRDLSIGPYIDKTSNQKKAECLEKWTEKCDLSQKFRCATQEEIKNQQYDIASRIKRRYTGQKRMDQKYTIEKIQKAIQKFYKQDPNTFDQILTIQGGGVIRWNIWKAKMTFHQKNNNQFNEESQEDQFWKKEIQKDVQRTFPYEKFFTSNECVSAMQKLLNKISQVFPLVGYCQGMNYIIAFILMVAGGDFFDAWTGVFSLFTNSQWLLYGLFMPEFPLYQILAILTSIQLKNKNKQVFLKMKQLEIDDSFLIQKWIITMYTYNIPLQVSLFLWDAIIAKGIWIMADINVLLINQISEEILICKNQDEFLDIVERMYSDKNKYFSHYNKINHILESNYEKVSSRQIIQCVQELSKKIQNEDSLQFLECFDTFENDVQFKFKYQQFMSKHLYLQ